MTTHPLVADLVDAFKSEGRIVIVGASLAGLRAAEALRAEGFHGSLTIRVMSRMSPMIVRRCRSRCSRVGCAPITPSFPGCARWTRTGRHPRLLDHAHSHPTPAESCQRSG